MVCTGFNLPYDLKIFFVQKNCNINKKQLQTGGYEFYRLKVNCNLNSYL